MKKLFVPHDLTLRLKGIGFDDIPCLAIYYGDFENPEDIEFVLDSRETQYYAQKRYKNGVLVPTFEQAFDWFIDTHKLFPEFCYQHWTKNYASMIYPDSFYVYDCTIHEARVKCLTRLIEIVESRLNAK